MNEEVSEKVKEVVTDFDEFKNITSAFGWI